MYLRTYTVYITYTVMCTHTYIVYYTEYVNIELNIVRDVNHIDIYMFPVSLFRMVRLLYTRPVMQGKLQSSHYC